MHTVEQAVLQPLPCRSPDLERSTTLRRPEICRPKVNQWDRRESAAALSLPLHATLSSTPACEAHPAVWPQPAACTKANPQTYYSASAMPDCDKHRTPLQEHSHTADVLDRLEQSELEEALAASRQSYLAETRRNSSSVAAEPAVSEPSAACSSDEQDWVKVTRRGSSKSKSPAQRPCGGKHRRRPSIAGSAEVAANLAGDLAAAELAPTRAAQQKAPAAAKRSSAQALQQRAPTRLATAATKSVEGSGPTQAKIADAACADWIGDPTMPLDSQVAALQARFGGDSQAKADCEEAQLQAAIKASLEACPQPALLPDQAAAREKAQPQAAAKESLTSRAQPGAQPDQAALIEAQPQAVKKESHAPRPQTAKQPDRAAVKEAQLPAVKKAGLSAAPQQAKQPVQSAAAKKAQLPAAVRENIPVPPLREPLQAAAAVEDLQVQTAQKDCYGPQIVPQPAEPLSRKDKRKAKKDRQKARKAGCSADGASSGSEEWSELSLSSSSGSSTPSSDCSAERLEASELSEALASLTIGRKDEQQQQQQLHSRAIETHLVSGVPAANGSKRTGKKSRKSGATATAGSSKLPQETIGSKGLQEVSGRSSSASEPSSPCSPDPSAEWVLVEAPLSTDAPGQGSSAAAAASKAEAPQQCASGEDPLAAPTADTAAHAGIVAGSSVEPAASAPSTSQGSGAGAASVSEEAAPQHPAGPAAGGSTAQLGRVSRSLVEVALKLLYAALEDSLDIAARAPGKLVYTAATTCGVVKPARASARADESTRKPTLPVRCLRTGLRAAYTAAGCCVGIGTALTRLAGFPISAS